LILLPVFFASGPQYLRPHNQKQLIIQSKSKSNMKKAKLLVAVIMTSAMLMAGKANAQEIKGKNFINAGIGIGTFGFSGTGGLPITASVEHGFTDKISGGLYLGFITRNFLDDYKYRYFVAGARASYHFNELLNVTNEKLDVYGGAALYYRNLKVKYNGHGDDDLYKASAGAVGIGIFAAGRYYFSDNIGAYAELGYGISPLQIGVTFKL
jgi:hypothetical protein